MAYSPNSPAAPFAACGRCWATLEHDGFLERRLEGIVAYYRVYIVTRRNCVVGGFDLTCGTAREACMVAESMLEPDLKAEIWSGGQWMGVVTLRTALHRPTLLS